MDLRWTLSLAVLGCVISAAAQDQPKLVNDRPLPTPAEELRERGMDTTRPTLLAALRNDDPSVRSLAAQELAWENAREAVRAVEEALDAEKVPGVRVKLAYSLAKLGNSKGLDVLESTCQENNVAPYLRLEAARLLAFDFNQEKPRCVSALLEFAQKGKPDAKAQALWLVPFYRHVSTEDSASILQAVIDALADPDTHVRHAAGHVLVGIADSASIPHLERALASEKDEYVRLQLQTAVQRLKEKAAQ